MKKGLKRIPFYPTYQTLAFYFSVITNLKWISITTVWTFTVGAHYSNDFLHENDNKSQKHNYGGIKI